MKIPTFLLFAYWTSCGIQLELQPASTRLYSQPIRAAKSTARFCASRFLLVVPSDHHDHSDRPALIQDVSATFEGLARSVIRSLSVTVARSPTIIIRHGVDSGPVLFSVVSGRVSWKSRLVPFRVSRDPP